ncbi:MAG: hypothetical protein QP798_11335 [Staphylococcus simulans]|uniref:hypothetical protein n=1 Tax=Staphylococcus TaxID=1279 RepID=UPI0008A99013|nr:MULTISPECIES: hypothetical protein [Staphylococcus]MDK7927827.1 hypothetical protein [Staphylococcus simulans]MDK8316516.1 hypothetical protein [Staphylococcus simulans]
MKLIDIQDEFLNYGKKLNFNLLKEGNVVRPDGSETFFNMSAISQHIDLFDSININGKQENYFTKQLSYFSNKLDDVGKNRLTNPMEIGLSLLIKNSDEPQKIINVALSFLTNIGLSINKIFIRCDREVDFLKWYNHLGISLNHIYEWKNLEKFHIGNNRPTGHYSYIYYKYSNGVVPIGTIATIKTEEKYHFDIVYYAERLSIILENKQAIWEIDEISPLFKVTNNLKINNNNETRFLLLFRVFILLIHGDLLRISNKGKGYFLKKILRELGFLLDGNLINEEHIPFILEISNEIITKLGYTSFSPKQKNAFYENILKINEYSVDIVNRLIKVRTRLLENEKIDFNVIKGEFGIFPEWIIQKFPELLREYDISCHIQCRDSIRSLSLGNNYEKVNIKKLLGDDYE